MKSKLMSTLILALVFALVFPFTALSQEKEKTVTVKTVQVENGKKIVKDTTFTVNQGDDIDAMVKPISWTSVSDSGELLTVDVEADGSEDGEVEKVIIIKNEGGECVKVIEGEDGNVIVLRKGGNMNCDENVFFTPGHGPKRVMKWTDGDSLVYEFEIQSDMKGFHREMEMHELEMQKMQKNLQEELSEIEGLNEEQIAEILEEINNMDFHYVMPPNRSMPPMKWRENNNFEYYFDGQREGGVSDIELREANIKNKPDRLDLENIEIEIANGVVEISFQGKGIVNPKILVYNVYGDKIFTGSPVLMNDNYEIKMDLSQKQHGTYYWQIVEKEKSFTDKFRL